MHSQKAEKNKNKQNHNKQQQQKQKQYGEVVVIIDLEVNVKNLLERAPERHPSLTTPCPRRPTPTDHKHPPDFLVEFLSGD